MKILFILSLSVLILSACKAAPEKYLTQVPITVEQANLQDYWVEQAQAFTFSSTTLKRPNVSGFVKLKYLVDSNGNIFNPIVVESSPAGAWDQYALRALSHVKYLPSKANVSHTPVYVITEFRFLRE